MRLWFLLLDIGLFVESPEPVGALDVWISRLLDEFSALLCVLGSVCVHNMKLFNQYIIIIDRLSVVLGIMTGWVIINSNMTSLESISSFDNNGENNIVQIEDYFKAIKESIQFDEGEGSILEEDLGASKGNFNSVYQTHDEEDSQSSVNSQGEDISILSDTYSTHQEGGYHQPQEVQKLVVSKPKVELNLLYTQVAEETIKIMNKNQFKLTLKTRLREDVKGITIIAPPFIDRLSHQTLNISIDQIQQLGDIFNAILIEVSSEISCQSFQIPLIVRFQRPRLRLEYQGSTTFLNFNNNRHPNITVKGSSFQEYMLYLTSSHHVDVMLETPMTKSTVFPDELMVSNERRKIAIRSKNREFCLVARIKHTQLAFVCKISVID